MQVVGNQIRGFVLITKELLDGLTVIGNLGRKNLKDFNKENEDKAKKAAEYAEKQRQQNELNAKLEGNRKTILESVGDREREILEKQL